MTGKTGITGLPMKRQPVWFIRFVVFCMMISLITGCGAKGNPGEGTVSTDQSDSSNQSGAQTQADTLHVHVFKIGKADAILLMCGDKTMIIDCGEDEDGEEILSYLLDRGIEKVDVLLITHYDKDHVGGADYVVRENKVDQVILPAYVGTNSEYMDFMKALDQKKISRTEVTEPMEFSLGQASVTVEPPQSYVIPNDGKEYDNDLSLITTVEFAGKRLVFAGDIEKQRISEWLAGGTVQKCDVLKVPHHGVYNKALGDLFEALQPSYAVICDSDKNPAEEKTMELIKNSGAECLETRNGDISIICSDAGIDVYQ